MRLRGGRTRQRPCGGDDHLHEHRRGESPTGEIVRPGTGERSANGPQHRGEVAATGARVRGSRRHRRGVPHALLQPREPHAPSNGSAPNSTACCAAIRSMCIRRRAVHCGTPASTASSPRVADGASPSRPPTRSIRAGLRRLVPHRVLLPRIAPNTGNAIRMVAATGANCTGGADGFDLSGTSCAGRVWTTTIWPR